MKYKICSICKIKKPTLGFYKRKNSKDGLTANCKICDNFRRKEYRIKNQEKEASRLKEYYSGNQEKIKNQSKQRYCENRDDILITHKKYYKENKEKIKLWNKEYCKKNKDDISKKSKIYSQNNKEKTNERIKKKRNENPEFRFIRNLRTLLYSSVKNNRKSHLRDYIDCSTDFFLISRIIFLKATCFFFLIFNSIFFSAKIITNFTVSC